MTAVSKTPWLRITITAARGLSNESISASSQRTLTTQFFANRLYSSSAMHLSYKLGRSSQVVAKPIGSSLNHCRYLYGYSAFSHHLGKGACISTRRDVRHILCISTRQKHSDVSNPSSLEADDISKSIQNGSQDVPIAESKSASSSTSIANTKHRTKRKKTQFSPINEITMNHPKNSKPPPSTTHAPLTRKQLLRLTQKQRANLKQHQIQQHAASRTYLDRARTNVRTNLKFLKGTAESNLKKNIRTIRRLFNGEEVWKDEVTTNESSKASSTNEFSNLQWENLPNAIKSNVQNNLTTMQNYLHKITNGIIPSPNLQDGTSSGSIATRLQQFYRIKSQQPVVMDNAWIAKNVLLALLPGAVIHVFCSYKQEEMKEFYAELEKKERERVFGSSGSNDDGGDVSPKNDNGSGSMGLSSVLVAEGGGTWDKLKMAVNDLFLGGVEDKVRVGVDGTATTLDSDRNSTPSREASPSLETSEKQNIVSEDASSDKDATIQALLERIQALEKQVGIEQHSQAFSTKYEMDRKNQPPMRNRRDDHMISQWRKLEEEKKENESKDHNESSTLQIVIDGAKHYWSTLDVDSLMEWVHNKLVDLADKLPFAQPDDETVTDAGKTAVTNSGESQNSTEVQPGANNAAVTSSRGGTNPIPSEKNECVDKDNGNAINQASDTDAQLNEDVTIENARDKAQGQGRWRKWRSRISPWQRKEESIESSRPEDNA